MDLLGAVSALCGWVYTFCWSLSFYPQPLLNARRRGTAGTTVDFPLINSLGFLCYLASTAALRYSAAVRTEYAARHHGLTPTVAFNDVAFAAHALVLSLVTVSQYLLPGALWGWRSSSSLSGAVFASGNSGRRPSRLILGLAAGCITGVGLVTVLVWVSGDGAGDAEAAAAWAWLDVVYALGYAKLVITLVKYAPQVLANYRHRSTAGWSIAQILLDAAGGGLSLAQLLLDSYRQRDWSGVTGNPVKLALGNVSLAYDAVFVAQHYVLYRGAVPAAADGDGDDDDEVVVDRAAGGAGGAGSDTDADAEDSSKTWRRAQQAGGERAPLLAQAAARDHARRLD
ncbi:lysosomal cystine transporter [Niveomyces insectorum RCEF 264]|uniref:Lysosomal cystine transporter n=1 Tax=Niveomyces insectorum RCEF 264 TaxID=1081102 RepID=A0A167X820_9HYPO|nr:lysosomal cystine transporter [Niveomyces insectorum RCEF 264]